MKSLILSRRDAFFVLVLILLAPVKGTNAGCFLRPIVNVSFSPAFAVVGATPLPKMTILLINPDPKDATLDAPFTNILPFPMTTSGEASTTCTGGSLTTNITSLTLAGATIPGNGSCTITVDVTSAVSGTYTNVIPAHCLKTNHCSNAESAAATLNLTSSSISTPTVTKAFDPVSTAVTVPSQLTITVSNSSSSAITNVSFIDNLPLGLQMLAVVSKTNCGTAPLPNVNISESSISVSEATIAAGQDCSIVVSVSPRFADNFINTIQSGAVSSSAGTNDKSAAATLTALGPAVAQAFFPSVIDENNSTLTITLLNPPTLNASPAAAVLSHPFVHILPAGVFVNGSATTTCGGRLFAEGRIIKLVGGGIRAGTASKGNSCEINVQVNTDSYGSFSSEIPINALQTSIGPNAYPSFATLRSLPLEG